MKKTNPNIITTILGTVISIFTIVGIVLKASQKVALKDDFAQFEERINIKFDTTYKGIIKAMDPIKSDIDHTYKALDQHIKDQRQYERINRKWNDSIYYNQLMILNGLSEKKNGIPFNLTVLK